VSIYVNGKPTKVYQTFLCISIDCVGLGFRTAQRYEEEYFYLDYKANIALCLETTNVGVSFHQALCWLLKTEIEERVHLH